MTIPLRELLPPTLDPKACKVHCAVHNGTEHPIDVLANSWDDWTLWNRYRSNKDDYNRQFIFSLARDRNDSSVWLFGGIWEVMSRGTANYDYSYEIRLREDLMRPYIKRLKVHYAMPNRTIRRSMENCIDQMSVHSILDEPYAGEAFPGMDSINHTLGQLRIVTQQEQIDWKLALAQMKGVYVWHDTETKRRYVGSASGDEGVWQRLCDYGRTLHGENDGLIALHAEQGDEYMLSNLRFALLEYWSHRTDRQHVLNREEYWKDVLLSRKKQDGLNA